MASSRFNTSSSKTNARCVGHDPAHSTSTRQDLEHLNSAYQESTLQLFDYNPQPTASQIRKQQVPRFWRGYGPTAADLANQPSIPRASQLSLLMDTRPRAQRPKSRSWSVTPKPSDFRDARSQESRDRQISISPIRRGHRRISQAGRDRPHVELDRDVTSRQSRSRVASPRGSRLRSERSPDHEDRRRQERKIR